MAPRLWLPDQQKQEFSKDNGAVICSTDGVQLVPTGVRINVAMAHSDNNVPRSRDSNLMKQSDLVIRPGKKPPDPERCNDSPYAPVTCIGTFGNVADSDRMCSTMHHEVKWYASGIGVDKSTSEFLGCVQTTTSAKGNIAAITDFQKNGTRYTVPSQDFCHFYRLDGEPGVYQHWHGFFTFKGYRVPKKIAWMVTNDCAMD